jgi:hypothetical protein
MYFVVDPDKEVSGRHEALIWERLWELRDLAPVGAMLPAAVTSRCPLLPDETADGLLVASLTQVPSGSAWVPLEVDLTRYARAGGEMRLGLLDDALRTAVEKGEDGHDVCAWPGPGQRYDSRLNRRLAVLVRGWGDLVARRGQDPTSLSTLAGLRRLAAHVAEVLVTASREMARQRGYCPALDVAGARVLQHGAEMNARWRRAVVDNALRHRNLLTLSPWDVFPRAAPADFAYADLVPLIACADSVSLRRDVTISHWNVTEFKKFHDRVAAILRRSGGQSLIAKQV